MPSPIRIPAVAFIFCGFKTKSHLSVALGENVVVAVPWVCVLGRGCVENVEVISVRREISVLKMAKLHSGEETKKG